MKPYLIYALQARDLLKRAKKPEDVFKFSRAIVNAVEKFTDDEKRYWHGNMMGDVIINDPYQRDVKYVIRRDPYQRGVK